MVDTRVATCPWIISCRLVRVRVGVCGCWGLIELLKEFAHGRWHILRGWVTNLHEPFVETVENEDTAESLAKNGEEDGGDEHWGQHNDDSTQTEEGAIVGILCSCLEQQVANDSGDGTDEYDAGELEHGADHVDDEEEPEVIEDEGDGGLGAINVAFSRHRHCNDCVVVQGLH